MRPEDPPETDSPEDVILHAEVEHAIAPYKALLPPEMLQVLRDVAKRAYTEHPAGRRILRNLKQPLQ